MADFELLGVGAVSTLVDGVKGYRQVTDAQIAALVRSLFTRTTPESHTHALTDATPVLAGLKVYGESTQDGTPTPSAPVEIVSVEPDEDGGVVLSVTGGGATVEIPIGLQNHALRSLPDGTRDEVTVDAGGNVTLVQRVGVATLTQALANGAYSYANLGTYGRAVIWVAKEDAPRAETAREDGGWCTMAPWVPKYSENSIHAYVTNSGSGSVIAVFATGSTAVEVTSKYVGAKFYYPLAVPQTIDLGQITPASLPAPELTAAIVPSAPSVLTVGRDPVAGFERLAASIATPDTSPATANHANGSLLMLDGQLVKATAAIAVGETIAIGTNVSRTTLADVIAAL